MKEIKTFAKKYDTWFLSNLYPVTIKFDELTYQTAEACFQAQKFKPEERVAFTNLDVGSNPRFNALGVKAKRLGGKRGIRELTPQELKEWDKVKLSVMEEIVRQKFLQNPELKEKLLATGNCKIYEGRTGFKADTYWGVLLENNKVVKGTNHLGNILMKIREELKRQGN